MKRFVLVLLLLTTFSSLTFLRADEIKLKSGEVIKDCKVKSKRKGKWTVILLSGKRRTINEADVAEHVEKETIADQLEAQAKKAGKDTAKLLEIGKEAHAAGAKVLASKLLRKVLRKDKNNAEVHKLLGNEKCSDGKWRGGRALEKFKAKELEASFKAKGYQKINGTWVDPTTARNLRAGYVKHEGRWYTPEHVKNLKAGKIWKWGTWYEAKDKANLDAGKLKYKGKWMSISDINFKKRDAKENWRLIGDHFIVVGPQGYDKLLMCLQQLDNTWEVLKDIFGQEPSTTKEDEKIVVTLYKNIKDYTAAHNAAGSSDERGALMSSAFGAYYDEKADGVIGYYYSESYLVQWTQFAAGCAFQARLFGYGNCPDGFFDAIGCYTMGLYKGKFRGYSEMHFNGYRAWTPEGNPIELLGDYDLSTKLGATAAERRFARLGFLVHYLREKHPDVLKAWVDMVFKKKGRASDLVKTANDMLKDKGADKEFAKFAKKFAETWEEPMPEAKR